MYDLLGKASNLALDVEIQIELFNKMVLPIYLYGCEVWGVNKSDIIENNYQKHVLRLKPPHEVLWCMMRLDVFPCQSL